ncbi:GNAT family N-acetyltransferase [Chitinibacter sp. GC72]|uniref:GNAT family N-acetyltransferase n=1 Tax=Chitinibacter sp. GC72 TaxID=1526917 RepID=UPI0012FC5678|nr:GNAT family N-acetyltransferase [Chitinibacter sp. GC72]
MSSPLIRNITPTDLPHILRIQSACYPANLLEDAATFAAKLQFAPHCNWLIALHEQPLGYLFTHPWAGDTPPALNRGDAAWPAQADRFYLHDLAIDPAGRGLQLGLTLAQHALDWAKAAGFPLAMLVAVDQADTFWRKLGFTATAAQDARLAQYGNAVLMQKTL